MLKRTATVLAAALACSAEVALADALRPSLHQDARPLTRVQEPAAAAPRDQQPASDTPAAAEPSPLVSCPEFGVGYWKTPDYPVCLLIGGYVAGYAERDIASEDLHLQFSYRDSTPTAVYEIRPMPPSERLMRLRAESLLYVESVMPISMGQLRSYVGLEGIHDGRDSSLQLKNAYVTLSRVKVGRHTSMFDFSPGYNETKGYASDTTTNLLAYRQPLGDNASAIVSLEDSHARRRLDGVWAVPGGQEVPDAVLVGRLAGRQGDIIQAAGALHHLKDGRLLNGATPAERLGWAALLGFEKRIPYRGDRSGRFLLSGAYAVGALNYLGFVPHTSDYIVDANRRIVPTHGYSVLASYEHGWTSTLTSAITVSGYRTTTDTPELRWETGGVLASLGMKYTMAQEFRVGAELSYYFDIVHGDTADTSRKRADADFLRAMLFFKRFF